MMTNARYVNSRDDILDYIVAFKIKYNGIAPSNREIKKALGISSTSLVAYHLDQMADEGLLTYPLGRNVPRAIGVPGYEFTETDDDTKELG